MSLPITPCESCDNVHADTRKQPPFKWRCVRFPVIPGLNPVSPSYLPDPPWALCDRINHGSCPLWTPRRHPPEIINQEGTK